MKSQTKLMLEKLIMVTCALLPCAATAFDSGSTGADGAFTPAVNTVLQLPPSGIFNFTTVNIPAGVTVRFQKNAANTPVVMLASGNVTIAGDLLLTGLDAPGVGAAGSGSIGDDGLPGTGGPGGFDGGRGGAAQLGAAGGSGLGPGGGRAGGTAPSQNCGPSIPQAGGGGGFGADGGVSPSGCLGSGTGGKAYGSSLLLPLIGGSGGGGAAGGSAFSGGGGGGGGGAILIASSGTANVTGKIRAFGGAGGATSGVGAGTGGGAGSGGAIRIVATTIAGNGEINANGNQGGQNSEFGVSGGSSGVGRIRLEAESITRTAATTPPFTFAAPGALFVAGLPTLAITSVAGVAAPAVPTGAADITLPATTPNPVTVVVTTANVPVGNIVSVSVTPAVGTSTSVVTPALTGSTFSASASVQVTLPTGPSTLQAQTTYTIVAALGDALRNFAGNERVEKIVLSATLGGGATAQLITVSGKVFDAPAEALRIAALGG